MSIDYYRSVAMFLFKNLTKFCTWFLLVPLVVTKVTAVSALKGNSISSGTWTMLDVVIALRTTHTESLVHSSAITLMSKLQWQFK
jgi:hypothetical protein